jgi:type 2A phosphatase activator TIP41
VICTCHTMDSTSSETVYPAEEDEPRPGKVEELFSPVPHKLTCSHASRSIAIAGWTITATKLPISSSSEGDELSKKIGIPVPEMTFGNNSVTVAGPNGLQCEFNTQESLDSVDKTGSKGIKVSYSEQWNRTRHGSQLKKNVNCRARDSEDIKGIVKPYDWTYTTPYRGSVNRPAVYGPNFVYVLTQNLLDSEQELPLDKLRRPDPILFYDEVDLYEDELGDNGISLLSIKVRVMPERMLLLARFFLRLDDVIFRVRDTRLYVEFGTGQVLRDYSVMESPYAKLKQVRSIHVP